jgi:MYXO-CTERM domain-containing protein
MKVKHLTLASAGSLLMVGAAQAAFLGVEMKSMDHWFSTDHPTNAVKTAYNAGSFDSYRIYAVFDSPGEVIGTFGAPGQVMFLNNKDGTGFFNRIETDKKGNTTHYDTAPTGGLTTNPARAYDTFASIGVHQGADATQFSPPGSGSNNGGVGNRFQNDWSSNEGTGGTYAWFVAGFPAQAQATQTPNGLFSPNSPHGAATDGRYYVLLYQVTVAAGNGVEGQFGVNVRNEGNKFGENTFFTTNQGPTPGALALLGLAGLAGGRRRRSA